MVLDDTCRWLSVEDSRREAAAPEWYLVQPPVCSSEQASTSFQEGPLVGFILPEADFRYRPPCLRTGGWGIRRGVDKTWACTPLPGYQFPHLLCLPACLQPG